MKGSIRLLTFRAIHRNPFSSNAAIRVSSNSAVASSVSIRDGHLDPEKMLNLLFDKIDVIEKHVTSLKYNGSFSAPEQCMFEKMTNIESQVLELQHTMADAKVAYAAADVPESATREDLLEIERTLDDAAARVLDAHTVVKSTRELVSLATLISTGRS